MIVPVVQCDREVGNMRLLRIILGSSQRLIVLGSVVEGLSGRGARNVCRGGSHAVVLIVAGTM